MIVDVVATDYEDLATIIQEVGAWADAIGVSASIHEIESALRVGIEQGFVTAFQYSSENRTYEKVDLGKDALEHLHFLATASGTKLCADFESNSPKPL
jgi:hypothetical protein